MIAIAAALTAASQQPVDPSDVANPTGSPIVAEIDRLGQERVTELSFLVKPDGTASDCLVEIGSGSDELDSEACRILTERGRWRPEAIAKGKEAQKRIRTRIRWRIED